MGKGSCMVLCLEGFDGLRIRVSVRFGFVSVRGN